MASYSLRIKASAAKELKAVQKKDRLRLVARIKALATEPRPSGCEKLSGHNLYRIRQSNYRILYSIEDAGPIILVIKIGHRREVYR